MNAPLPFTVTELSDLLADTNAPERDKRKRADAVVAEIEAMRDRDYNPAIGPKNLATAEALIKTIEEWNIVNRRVDKEVIHELIAQYPHIEKLYDSLNDEDDRKLFRSQIRLVSFLHKGEKRISGERYLHHPLRVGEYFAWAALRENSILDAPFWLCSVIGHDVKERFADVLSGESTSEAVSDILIRYNARHELFKHIAEYKQEQSSKLRTLIDAEIDAVIQQVYFDQVARELGPEKAQRFSDKLRRMSIQALMMSKRMDEEYSGFVYRMGEPDYAEGIGKTDLEIAIAGKQCDQPDNIADLDQFSEDYLRLIRTFAKGIWGVNRAMLYFFEKTRMEEPQTKILWTTMYLNAAAHSRAAKKTLQTHLARMVRTHPDLAIFTGDQEKRLNDFTRDGGFSEVTSLEDRAQSRSWYKQFHGTSEVLFNYLNKHPSAETQTFISRLTPGIYSKQERDRQMYTTLITLNRWFMFYFAAKDYALYLPHQKEG